MLMKLNFTLMKLKPLFAIAVLLLSYSVTLASDYVPGIGQSVHVSLTPRPVVSGQDPEHYDELNNGHRLPTRPIPCIIGENGVTLQMDCEPEITSYDIYDVDGVLIASFGDEDGFIQTLFSLTGEYTVAFATSEYVYTGYVNI